MTPERLQRIDGTFQAALDLAPERRGIFLAEVNATDPELHAEVDALLRAHVQAADFIENPASDIAASLLGASPPRLTRVGQYKVDELLGAGGMAEVYLATDRMGRKVALKMLMPRHIRDAQHVRRFLQEARAVLALNHPNIVTVYDIGESDGVYYIASELIEGETLRRALDTRTFTLDALLEIAIQIATGIAAAHERGIVHRDIKPDNVMIRADGYVKVLDFGIAKLTRGFHDSVSADTPIPLSAETREGFVIGTVSYMSPEQTRGAKVDERADVWSFGAMFYEMLTGQLPFAGGSAAEVVGRIFEREPAPLARYVNIPSDELQRIVAKALMKDPDERYRTITALLEELKALKQELEFATKLERLSLPDAGPQHRNATKLAQRPAEPPQAEPYVFICYAHEDAARVYPRIEFLEADGINVWVDKGMVAGTVWRREIDSALERATHVVFFVSRASLSSDHCEGEVHVGLDHKKTVVPVFLEDVQVTAGLRVALSRLQALYGYRLSDDALDQQLRHAIRSDASTASTPIPLVTVSQRSARLARRNRIVWTSAALAMLIAIASGIWWYSRVPHSAPLPTRSVAVLPFAAMSEDPRIRHLADAFVEQLLNDFTAQRQIKVASRTGSAAKPTDEGIPAFAAALNVSYVVEGSVRPGGEGDRVTAQLIRGSDGLHLWSQTFDLGLDGTEMESTASRVALNAFRYVENDVLIAEARTYTSNDEAFAYYEKAFRLDPSGEVADTNQVGVAQTLINLDKAIELDPGFPEPYIERAGQVAEPAETRRMIDRYLELRPDSAKGRTMLGLMQEADGDLAAAEQSFKEARELEPEFPWPYSRLGLLAMTRGNAQEAADYFKQSTVNNATKPSHFFYGWALVALERLDEADLQFELQLRLFPNDIGTMVTRVAIAHWRGRNDEAKARFDAAWAKYGKSTPQAFISVLPFVGREQQLRDLMKAWDAGTQPTNAGERYGAYAALGEYDAAIDWLLRALDEKTAPPWIRVEGLYRDVHKHPRYAEVAAKLDAQEVSH